MEKDNEKIITVCMPTCNRPEQLQSALSSLIGHLKKYSRTPRILIVDDSENPESAKTTKEICDSYRANYEGKIEYIDRNDRAEMAKMLAKEKGISEEVLNFALLGDKLSTTTIGSVRNTCLLKTRGEKILMIDDDVIYDFFSPINEGSPLFSIENSYDFYFLKNDEVPSPPLFKSIEIDLLSAHEKILGKKVSEILGKNTPEYMEELEIVDTYMGAYGDSPMESHLFLPFQPNVRDKLKNASSEEYEEMKNTKRIIQTPLSKTIYQGIMCIGMVMGVDNRDLVSPFFPNGRSEDLIFGVTRYNAFPSKVSGHIPIMIGHQRPYKETRPPSYDSFYTTNMNKAIVFTINEVDGADVNPLENLKRIGEKFITLTKSPPQTFFIAMETQCQKIIQEVVNYITNFILENSSGMPDFWVNYAKSIINDLSSPSPELFMADITKNPKEEREKKMLILQKWMNLYGQLLQEWHKLL